MPGSTFPSALEALSFRFDEIVRLLSRRIDAALAVDQLESFGPGVVGLQFFV